MRTNPREIRCTDSLRGSLAKEAEQIRDRLTSLWGEHCSGPSPAYTIVDASDSSPLQSKNLACGLYTMNGLAAMLGWELRPDSYQCSDMALRKWVAACILETHLLLPPETARHLEAAHEDAVRHALQQIDELTGAKFCVR